MAGQVVGYVINDTVLCPTCAERVAEERNIDLENDPTVGVFFDDTETDVIFTCEECNSPLDTSPTTEGLRWIAGFVEETIEPRIPADVSASEKIEAIKSEIAETPGLGKVGVRWFEIAVRDGYYDVGEGEEAGKELEEELLSKYERLLKLLKDM